MNINLSQTSAAARAQQRRDRMFVRAMLIASLILLIVAGAYVFFRTYNKKLEGDIVSVDNEINRIEANMSKGKAVEVANALFRVRDIENSYVQNSVVLSLLEAISESIIDNVGIDEYEYTVSRDSIDVDVTMATTDILSIAQQIKALKQSELFYSVAVEGVSREQNSGNIRFHVLLKHTLKNKKEVTQS